MQERGGTELYNIIYIIYNTVPYRRLPPVKAARMRQEISQKLLTQTVSYDIVIKRDKI